MAKVVTSEGIKDFVDSKGATPTEVFPTAKRSPPGKAAPIDMRAGDGAAPPVVAPPEEKASPGSEAKSDAPPEKLEETGLDAEDHDLAERAKKRIGKKHYEMRKAQEEAAKALEEAQDSERFAENLFNEREEWRRRAEAAEKEREELRSKAAPPAPAVLPIKAPEQTDAKYWNDKREFQLDAFVSDSVAFKLESDRRQAAADRERELAAKQKAENEAIDRAYASKIEKAKATKYRDWDDTVAKSDVQLPNAVLDYIRRSEYGVDLAHFLATNKDIADKVRAMHFTLGIAELGKLETSFSQSANSAAAEKTTAAALQAAPKTVERPGAPAPITPISTSGTGTIVLDPAKMDFKALRAYEREREAQKRRR